ncbi:bifunctional metallophosphatase/5'-nucleotidase [Mycoplasmopsis gallopavonis]|uniref:Trifunctional nucleotide phosphoesterase protein YfkN n=1 Tax=Mycoplasmopsis gallopavonis TaxID=76629 RepID=A0A449AZX8_9BACT|nr:bifunctional UDP-sugar hydrolase/5'-nucleotidase [Mycoplasmopsis gallopavonis]RIV16432.1 bifunctional metallophosphatase/5'-nucleotidase [Mycoplasmopsis gallopavonis]VEU73044.1 Trifunctional nucleotide phosphoesterase protein YfkN precursor [Mycoplasmopsis gallopavonis]
MKIKKIFWISSALITPVAISPILVSAACSNHKFSEAEVAKIQAKFDKFEEDYNNQLIADANKYSEMKKAFDNLSAEPEKETSQTKIKEFLVKTRLKYLKLDGEYQKIFKELKKAEKDAKLKTLKIYHTNDEHGRIKFDDGKYSLYSGMEGLAQYLSDLPRDLLLSAGDLIQGLPLSDSDKGKTITKIANFMKYDAIAIGNHEFDYGLDHILSLDHDSKTPFLSGNITYNHNVPDKENQDVFKPYIVKNINGYKIAIMGITTPDTAYTSHPSNSVNVNFIDPVEAAKKVVKQIQDKEKVNFIIALTHLGVGRDIEKWDSTYLAKNVPGIDLILDGHSHTKVPAHVVETSETYHSQTEAYTKFLGDITLRVDTSTGKIVKLSQNLRDINQIQVARSGINSKTVAKLIADLQTTFDQENKKFVFNNIVNFEHIISKTVGSSDYWIGRVAPTMLGIFASDAIAHEFVTSGQKDDNLTPNINNTIGLMNGGGIRADLPAGPINKEDILKLSPFGNRVSAVKITGAKLIEVIKHGMSKIKTGGYAQYSHNVKFSAHSVNNGGKITYEVDPSSIRINDQEINPTALYYVVTNDYLVAGGDQYGMLDYKKNSDVKLVYESQELIKSFIDYAKWIANSANTSAIASSAFGWPLAKYGTENPTSYVTIEYES